MSGTVNPVSSSSSSSEIVLRDYQELPGELLLHVFSYFSLRTVWACSIVSRRFREISGDNRLWRVFFVSFYGERAALGMEQLIMRNSISWHTISLQIRSLSCLSSFTLRLSEGDRYDYVHGSGRPRLAHMEARVKEAMKRNYGAKEETPTFCDPDFLQIERCIPQGVVKVHGVTYTISACRYVKTDASATRFAAPDDAFLTHLAYNHVCLYALSDDGRIFQWDLEGEQAPIETFQTSLSKGELTLSEDVQCSPLPVAKHFLYRDGFIVILYQVDESDQMILETIDLVSCQRRRVKKIPKDIQLNKITIRNKKLYIFEDKEYFIIELKNMQIKRVDLRGKAFPAYEDRPYQILGCSGNQLFVYYGPPDPRTSDRTRSILNNPRRFAQAWIKSRFVTLDEKAFFADLCVHDLEDGALLQQISNVQEMKGPYVKFGDLLFVKGTKSRNNFTEFQIYENTIKVLDDYILIFDLRAGKQIGTVTVAGTEEEQYIGLAHLINICFQNQHLMEPATVEAQADWASQLLDLMMGFHE